MNNVNKQALDEFGRTLMENVRDEAIYDSILTLDGQMRGDIAARVRQRFARFSAEDIALVKWLIPEIVDNCLHHLLWTLEQSDRIAVSVKTSAGKVPDINQVSDGLPGEMYSDEGWIARFSKYPAL